MKSEPTGHTPCWKGEVHSADAKRPNGDCRRLFPVNLDAWVAAHEDELIRFRRHVHAHPDLSNTEQPTAALVAERLVEAGLRPVMLPKGNGLSCDIGSGEHMVALRADLDALPLPDVKDVPYRSTVEGVCHACGHDVHTTVVLGAGLALASLGDALPGRVRLLFQPAEEALPSGSLDVINAGRLAGVEEIFALHCDPRTLTGQVGLRSGAITAAADFVKVDLSGPGGHTARPHLTVDLVTALARVVTDVPALLARRVDVRSALSLVFGAVHSGVAPNAIPQSGTVSGSVRCLDHAAWELAPKLIEQLVHQVVAPTGAVAHVEYNRGMPPVVNHPHSAGVLSEAALETLGPEALVDTQQSMGGEDFSWYLEHCWGAMARLGVGRPGEALDLHQGSFDIDEKAIGIGVRLLANTALIALRERAL
ncbi:amidohydrolase [Cryptosporangium arvum]|uniref:amidohydrolase n=1 Tax=Cryptosporangium arvum TaxID=80871 RepID=UPI0007C5C539